MLLSLKHVKTLPFASVYLHTDFQNNGQQLANFNELGYILARASLRTTGDNIVLLIAAKDAEQISLVNAICSKRPLKARKWPTTDFHQ